MRRVSTILEMRGALAAARADGARIGFVPTMGALHEGHLALVRLAAEHCDAVVVSVFVNPTQFDAAGDLDAYPRDLDGDERALAALGARRPTWLFAPSVAQLYPRPPLTTVHVAGLTDRLCGATRPGHFDGVATVVTKLLSIVTPDVAVFGRKDRQQLEVVRRLVADLDLPVTIVAGPTVREADGVALSSRNRRLAADERSSARALPLALRAAVQEARSARAAGAAVDPDRLAAAARGRLDAAAVDVDYLEVVDARTLAPPDPARPGNLVVAVAAHIGPVRLIDNVEVGDLDDEARLLDAVGDRWA